jgi:hypothetical protein
MSKTKKENHIWPLFAFWAIIGLIGYKLSFSEFDYSVALIGGATLWGAIEKLLKN